LYKQAQYDESNGTTLAGRSEKNIQGYLVAVDPYTYRMKSPTVRKRMKMMRMSMFRITGMKIVQLCTAIIDKPVLIRTPC
jgi:hypothetical protein